MPNTTELKNRVEAKKHALLAAYNQLKADTRAEAGDARDRLKQKLDDLEDYVKDGWENVSDAVSAKLKKWLKDN